ncbi:hypothetical protein K466DRAFT_64648 [Polyporus arcularius HHB13444]|uniref:Uncharacterized protein n=1 Tax=Polyporus arcularius HHB13444 TaxID=1314778 RepID=A0A5C3PH78_9APHY|nr:hypothetical protein K466DRAFT_64648 [Polyporus arcularius HHB13444]
MSTIKLLVVALQEREAPRRTRLTSVSQLRSHRRAASSLLFARPPSTIAFLSDVLALACRDKAGSRRTLRGRGRRSRASWGQACKVRDVIARAKLRLRARAPLQLAPLCPISESQGSSFARWVGVRHTLQPSCVVSVLEQLLWHVLQEGVRRMTFSVVISPCCTQRAGWLQPQSQCSSLPVLLSPAAGFNRDSAVC